MNAPVQNEPRRQPTSQAAAAELLAAGEALCRAARVIAELGAQRRDGRPGRNRGALPTPEERLSGKQLGAIRAASRRAGLSRDQLSDLLEEMTGKQETAALSRSDASLVLDRLTEMTGYAR